MVTHLQTIRVAVCCLTACLFVGCMQGPEIEQARQAELAGAPHEAYDLYCRAAEFDRHDRWLGRAIGRVAPEAAKHWERLAHRAMDRGDHAEAWRLFVRVLEIQPGHPSAPHLIRRLERDHAEAIQLAKADWQSSGAQRLGTVRTRSSPGRPASSPGRPASSPRRPTTSKRPPRPAASTTSVPPRTIGPGIVEPRHVDRAPAARPPSALKSAPPVGTGSGAVAAPVKPSARSRRSVPPFRPVVAVGPPATSGVVNGKPAADKKPGAITGRVAASRPSGVTSRPAPRPRRPMMVAATRPAVRTLAPVSGRSRRAAYPGVSRRSPFQFVAIRTLSKKDPRFPKKVRTVDGLTVELRDTDDDPDADFYVYLGDRRVAKYKGVPIGRPCAVIGRSGKVYEVVVLSIVDSRRTIRFGIRPSQGSGKP